MTGNDKPRCGRWRGEDVAEPVDRVEIHGDRNPWALAPASLGSRLQAVMPVGVEDIGPVVDVSPPLSPGLDRISLRDILPCLEE